MSGADQELMELDRLVHALEEERISDGDFARLQELLRASETARAEYVRRCDLSVSLTELAGESVQETGADELVFSTTSRSWKGAALGLAAALVGAVALLAFRSDRESNPALAEREEPGCAVLMATADLAGGELPAAVGSPLPSGSFEIGSGLVELEFYSGASVVIEGPASFRLESATAMSIEEGRLRAHVPPPAQGFTVMTDEFEVVDLGTDFAVWARTDEVDEVHVLEGEVEIREGGGSERILAGEAVGGGGAEVAFAPHRFIGSDGVGERVLAYAEQQHDAWQAFSDELQDDRRLAVYFPLAGGAEASRDLPNVAAAAAGGAVVGARWVPGRVPGKRALSFKSSGDRVRLNVTGEHEAITLAAWVQVDGLDRLYNSLFLTDGWSAGNPHWQIDRDGRLILGIKRAKSDEQYVFYSPPVFGTATAGRWVHVVSSFDTRTGIGLHFVDGELVQRLDTGGPTDGPIRMGAAELGNWGLPDTTGPRAIRNLNGKIDEFMLFTEALDAADVRRLYASQPEPTL